MKKILSLVLALTMVLTSFGVVFAADEEPAFPRLTENGILIGGDDGDLMLDQDLIRAQFATFALRLAGWTDAEIAAAAETADFTDVAADAWYAPAVGLAVKEGLMFGVGGGLFNPEGPATYVEVLTVLARILGYDTEGLAWPMGYYALAVTAGLVDEEVAVGEKMTRLQMAEAIEIALDAEMAEGGMTLAQEIDIAPTVVSYEVAEDGKSITILFTDDEEVVFELDAALVANEETEVTFEHAGLTFTELVTWEVELLEVVSVTATNLVEVEVVFSIAVDKASAEKEANYSLGVVKSVNKATLQEDGKTVILSVDELDNQKDYKLTVDKIEDAEKLEAIDNLAKTEVEFTPFDAELPEVVSIEFTGPKAFRVLFDEPIETAAKAGISVKTEAVSLSVNTATVSAADNRIVEVALFSTLVDGTEYTFRIKDQADYAGYNNMVFAEELAYNKVEDAPVATAELVSQTVVKVSFDRPVVGLSEDDFYHSFTAWQPKEMSGNAALTDTSIANNRALSAVWLDFENYPLPAGDIEFVVRRAAVASGRIKDAWGNELQDTAITLAVEDDRVAPEVTEIKVISKDEFRVTFSEKVKAFDDTMVQLLDDEGDKVDVTLTVSHHNKNTWKVEISKSQEGKVRNVKIEDVRDDTLHENKMADFTEEVAFGDLVFDGVNRVEFDETARVLYIVFNEEMNNTALDTSNYKLEDDLDFSFSGAASFFAGRSVVKIELTVAETATVKEDIGKDLLISGDVEDVAGNKISGFQVEELIVALGHPDNKPNLAAPSKNPIRFIDTKTVTVQFNQELVYVVPTDFTVTTTSSITIAGVELTNNSTGSLVTLSLVDHVPHDLTNTELEAAFTNTVNVFGVSPKAIAQAVTEHDYIAPAVALTAASIKDITITDKWNGTNHKADTITIVYTEAIDVHSLSRLTYLVDGKHVISVTTAGNTVVLLLEETTGLYDTVSPAHILQALDITDNSAQKNVLAGSDKTADRMSIIDGIAPVPVTATAVFVSSTAAVEVFEITLDFSEVVSSSDGAIEAVKHGADTVFTLDDGVPAGVDVFDEVVTSGAIVHTADTKTVTFEISVDPAAATAAINIHTTTPHVFDKAGNQVVLNIAPLVITLP